jgi:hypothetical protein
MAKKGPGNPGLPARFNRRRTRDDRGIVPFFTSDLTVLARDLRLSATIGVATAGLSPPAEWDPGGKLMPGRIGLPEQLLEQ